MMTGSFAPPQEEPEMLAAIYLRHFRDDYQGSILSWPFNLMAISIFFPDYMWQFITSICNEIDRDASFPFPSKRSITEYIGAGPLEELISEGIDDIFEELLFINGASPTMRAMLQHVWTDKMSTETVKRLSEIRCASGR